MTFLALRAAQYQSLSETIADPHALSVIQAQTPIPASLGAWLQNLALLKGLPFGYLVLDPAMLPPESARFFHLDPNWVNALIEGACSVGRSSSADLAHDAALAARLYASSQLPSGDVTGFLLRSAVVSGWPGLEINAYDSAGKALVPLRKEILSPSLLIFIVEGNLSYVTIHEPAEGLHFGVDLGSMSKQLRYVAPPAGQQPGGLIDGTSVAVTYRDTDQRVMKVADLARAMKSKLGSMADAFTPAEFALQLVEGVQSVRFDNDPSAPPSGL